MIGDSSAPPGRPPTGSIRADPPATDRPATAAVDAENASGAATSRDREARMILCCISDAGSAVLSDAVGRRGATVLLQEVAEGSSTLRGADRWRRRLDSLDIGAVQGRAAAVGARFTVPGDDDWWPGLADLAAVRSTTHGGGVPLGLWVRGEVSHAPAVAVVGTREATAYGVGVAVEMAAGLAESGVTTVSGAAFGIDAAVHRGALAAGGRTIAVLACGIDVAYPRGHAQLLDRIAGHGQVVAEMPPGATPTRQGFLTRNRLVAAMSQATVVVEAALRSGALNTASWAEGLVRVVGAVPGPISSPLSAGCHRLIRSGSAVLVTGADEVLQLVGPLGGASVSSTQDRPDARADLGGTARRVLEALPARGAVGLGRLGAVTGESPLALLAALGELGDSGLADRSDAGWCLSAADRAATRARSVAGRS